MLGMSSSLSSNENKERPSSPMVSTVVPSFPTVPLSPVRPSASALPVDHATSSINLVAPTPSLSTTSSLVPLTSSVSAASSPTIVTATSYTNDLKVQVLYELLRMYVHLLRPAIYPDDTRFLYLMTMCRLIDLSKEQLRHATVDEVVALPLLDDLKVWHLGELSRDFSTLLADQNTAAAVGRLTMLERMKKLESLIAYDDTYI